MFFLLTSEQNKNPLLASIVGLYIGLLKNPIIQYRTEKKIRLLSVTFSAITITTGWKIWKI